MNKVTTVNLGGNAFQIEESGYVTLQAYLDGASRRLERNPDKDEIIADIETGIADKFRSVLGQHKNVVLAKEVEAVLSEMGPVQDDSGSSGSETASAGAAAPGGTPPPPPPGGASASSNATGGSSGGTGATASSGAAKRLYRIPDGAMIGGVCNGVAAYFAVDVVLVRLVVLGVFLLAGLISIGAHWFFLLPLAGYIALAFLLPPATTAAEIAAARGDPATAQEYIRRAKEGYYRSFGGPGRRHWKREFKREMRAQRRHFRRYGTWDPTAPVPPVPPPVGPSFVLPLLGICQFALVLLTFWAVYALVTNGSVVGFTLPDGVPLWIGIVGIIFVAHVVIWPLKAMKYAILSAAWGKPGHVGGGFFDSLVWLAAVVAGVWLADHYIPAVHQFLLTLPGKIEQVGDAVRVWWNNGK